jgi:hypothetical protein
MRGVLPKGSVLVCIFCEQNNSTQKQLNAKDIHKEMFPVYGGKCLSHKRFTTGSRKFSQGRSKVAVDARTGHPVGIASEATMQRAEEFIRVDRRITIGSVATVLYIT